jgi:DNA mismatch endonuclease (patch repair protein)
VEHRPRSCFSVGKSGGNDKRHGNVTRDKRNLKTLRNLGWKVLVIWECQIKKPEKLINKISNFLKK